MPDNLTHEQRRRCMSSNRGVDTKPEAAVRSELHRRGLRFRKHARDLPGRPDVVFRRQKLAVFVDGDFWHGYRLSRWEHTLSAQWRAKITRTRQRDRRNFQKLRRSGWGVVRIWEHEVARDVTACADRIERTLVERGYPSGP